MKFTTALALFSLMITAFGCAHMSQGPKKEYKPTFSFGVHYNHLDIEINDEDVDDTVGGGVTVEVSPMPVVSLAFSANYGEGELPGAVIVSDGYSFYVFDEEWDITQVLLSLDLRIFPLALMEFPVQPFALVGGAWTEVEGKLDFFGLEFKEKESETGFRFGGGIDIKFEEAPVFFRAQVVKDKWGDDLDDVDQVTGSFGIGVRF